VGNSRYDNHRTVLYGDPYLSGLVQGKSHQTREKTQKKVGAVMATHGISKDYQANSSRLASLVYFLGQVVVYGGCSLGMLWAFVALIKFLWIHS
jgi:hypothetical protein